MNILKDIVETLQESIEKFHDVIVERIKNAFENTVLCSAIANSGVPENYALNVWTKHLGAGAGGSKFYVDDPVDLCQHLFVDNHNWKIVYPKDGIPGCTYFRLQLPYVIGVLGAIPLKDIPESEIVKVVKNKATQHYEVLVAKEASTPTNTVTLILGKAEGPCANKEVIFTIHPGDPLSPGKVDETSIAAEEVEMTARSAYNLGFRTAKFVREA